MVASSSVSSFTLNGIRRRRSMNARNNVDKRPRSAQTGAIRSEQLDTLPPQRAGALARCFAQSSTIMSVEGSSSRMSETLELPRNRRRGLKSLSTLLQIPLLRNRAGTGPIPVSTVGNLPTDILYELADHLHPSDLLGLSLTVRAFFPIPMILLTNCHRSVFICPRTLTTISI